MTARIFALIIGIDNYKAGMIWNLESCAGDAKNMKRWLTNDLNVPRDQICMLLDSEATRVAIEDRFMDHLVNNPAIESGDSIVIYFAGHGSTLFAPRDWFDGEAGKVEVLCTYDHDTKGPAGRATGISDRSMHAMVNELYKVKGDNITLILDCCFSPPFRSRMNMRDRQFTRWTPTTKATSEDLHRNLWAGAIGRPYSAKPGFFSENHESHTFLAACRSGERATEGSEGGRFTSALLEAKKSVALHRTTYAELINRLAYSMGEGQRPLCLGRNKDRILFGGTPFITDPRFVAVDLEHEKRLRVDAGAIHGIVEGTELSVHGHNCRGSLNPQLASLRIFEVHATWSLARCTSQGTLVPRRCWAQITCWNNRTPFRVYLKRTWCSFVRRWSLRRSIPSKPGGPPSRGGLNVIRVKRPAQADISLRIGRQDVFVERNNELVSSNSRRVIRIEKAKGDLNIIDDAARFHLHLHRDNPANPFRNLVTMELFRVDPHTWVRIGSNLLDNGKANLVYEPGAIYSIVMRNKSDVDLWPYLAYMDPNGYDINMIYHPEPSSKIPPLRGHGTLEVGSGTPGSEALSFTLADHGLLDSGFLKLFVSSTFTRMDLLEQGRPVSVLDDSLSRKGDNCPSATAELITQFWGTAFACVTFIRGQPLPLPA